MYDKLAGHDRYREDPAHRVRGGLQARRSSRSPRTGRWCATTQQDLVYKNEDAKWNAVVEDIVERNEKGQPVLVGTVSIEKSETLSGYLNRRGVPHHVLNAKNHEKEAMIVAQAGRMGSVTVATNMAGRGVDILLGGNPEYLARQEMAAREWDNDALPAVRDGGGGAGGVRGRVPADLRRSSRRRPTPSTRRSSSVGGLYVLGTERHESRRIDNQLRGRSGRQGDPGESLFYLSLEDDLMRLFAVRPDRLDHGAPEVAGRRAHHGEDGLARPSRPRRSRSRS